MKEIIDGWKKKSEPKGNHTTNYREVSVTGTQNYFQARMDSYGVYSPFNTGTVSYTIRWRRNE